MKDFLIFLPLTIVYFALKSTVFAGIPLPDLPLLIVFYIACRKPSKEGVAFSFILGILDDSFDGGIIGTTSFALVFIFLAIHLLARKVQFVTPGFKAGGAGFASIIKGILAYAILRFTGKDVSFLFDVVIQAVLTAVFAPAILVFLSKVTALVTPRTFKDNES